jgi:hypothetical protein
LLLPASLVSAAEWGVTAGVPLHGPVISTDFPSFCCAVPESWTRHPFLGLTASLPLASRFHIRLDATWQRWGISNTASGLVYLTVPPGPVGLAVTKQATAANRWRLPVRLQWDPQRHIRLGLGPELSLITASHSLYELQNPLTGSQSFPVDYFRSLDRQAVFGVGATAEFPFQLDLLTIAPDLHYTRWTAKHYNANFPLDELAAGITLRLGRLKRETPSSQRSPGPSATASSSPSSSSSISLTWHRPSYFVVCGAREQHAPSPLFSNLSDPTNQTVSRSPRWTLPHLRAPSTRAISLVVTPRLIRTH